MLYKNLGGTDLKISTIGIGTGFNFSSKEEDKKILSIIKFAVDQGINLIDTYPENHANGRSEKIVGKAVKKVRSKVFIATKFSPENSSYKKILNSCDQSLKRLGTDYVDIYQFHWPNPAIPFEQTIKALQFLIKKGKIRFVGAGNFSKMELSFIQSILKKNLVSLQSEYNLFERSVEQNSILSYCQKKKISLIAYSPLDQGRINNLKGKQFKLLNTLSKKYKKTFSQICLNWLTRNPQVVTIPRTLNPIHLCENIESINFDLDKMDFSLINKMFTTPIYLIPPNQISVSQKGERDRQVYTTLTQALENKLNLVPSPKELSLALKKGGISKPIRVIKSKNNNKIKYDLINGRVRYWAWVLAFGDKKRIPCYIRKDLD